MRLPPVDSFAFLSSRTPFGLQSDSGDARRLGLGSRDCHLGFSEHQERNVLHNLFPESVLPQICSFGGINKSSMTKSGFMACAF
jgi:hypothetical protein